MTFRQVANPPSAHGDPDSETTQQFTKESDFTLSESVQPMAAQSVASSG
jgi:hypothetical protein